MPTPLLIISDGVTSGTGLGRIAKDLAVRIATNLPDTFRVGTMGYGGPITRKLPFPQYPMEMKDWVLYNLPQVWDDFAGDEQGIIFTIWDASRMLWFARPENLSDPPLRKFLTTAKFERWGYFPMDASGPNDKLTSILGHTIGAYDRVLAYSKWAHDILQRTLSPNVDLDWRPHGIDTSVFVPQNHKVARHRFGERINARTEKGKWLSAPDDALMVGIVATNQIRKDFGLGIRAIAELKKERNVLLWIHTDELERHWSIPSLLYDFGFEHDKAVVTCNMPFTDEQMSWCYSACDVTLGIGLGEGFGYPIFESLACGTPCIHGHYGGAPEHMPEWMIVEPKMYRLEGAYSCVRPVFNPSDWKNQILAAPKWKPESLLPAHLDWSNLWPCWSEWLTRGVAGG